MNDRIKVISDGTLTGTRVLNADGKDIPNITKIVLTADAEKNLCEAVLTIAMVEVDATNIKANETQA